MNDVISYQAPHGGPHINLTEWQIAQFRAAGFWPKNPIGQEYCNVHRGLHWGMPTWSDARALEMAEVARRDADAQPCSRP